MKMGKSKGNKPNVKNNIFKVAGARCLKAKNKAKIVTADRLKHMNMKNKEKIENIDERLTQLNSEVRQPAQSTTITDSDVQKNRSSKMQKEILKYNETEKNCEQALDRLVSMGM